MNHFIFILNKRIIETTTPYTYTRAIIFSPCNVFEEDAMPPGDPLREQLIAQFDGLSGQLQQAARYLLEHPNEVALVSMRELARHAGVQPATMTRLAKALGLDGYEDLRAHYAKALRQGGSGFAAQVRATTLESPEGSERAEQVLKGLNQQVARLDEPRTLRSITAMAERLATARRVYVAGLRSCHAVAWHFHYVMSLLGERSVLLDGIGGSGGDALMRATADDVLLAISITPYAQETLALAEFAAAKGVGTLCITDSEVSPLVVNAEHAIICPTANPGFFHTLTPLLAISETLCTLLAEHDRAKSLAALEQADDYLKARHTYATAIPRRQ